MVLFYNVIPDGLLNFTLQLTVATKSAGSIPYYVGYSNGFNATTNVNAAATFKSDSAYKYVYALAPSGNWEVPTFSTTTGNPFAVAGDTASNLLSSVLSGSAALSCTIGATATADPSGGTNSASAICAAGGYSNLAVCGGLLYAYMPPLLGLGGVTPGAGTFCTGSATTDGAVVGIKAVYSGSSTQQSRTTTAAPVTATPAATSSNPAALLGPSAATSTTSGVCSVVLMLYVKTGTVWVTAGGSTAVPSASGGAVATAANIISGATYGCIPATTMISI